MVHRLALISNIGNFDQVASGAQLALSKFTVVYAENGRGKTTISAILRSLSTGDPAHIMERRRLGSQNPPHAVVAFANGTSHTFQNGSWSQTANVLTIFDDAFVAANVCSGLEVASDHRRNMHELILGAQGVTLNRALQEAVAKIESHNRFLRQKSDAIPTDVMGGLAVDDFCALPRDPNIDSKVQEAERARAAVEASSQVKDHPLFSAIQLPVFDVEAVNRILNRTIADLDAEAVRQVQHHIAGLGPEMGAWVATGVDHIEVDANGVEHCPFCTQSLAGIGLINHYRAYFGEAYRTLRRDIGAARSANRALHGDDVPAAFERAIRVFGEQRQFWARFAEMPEIRIDTAEMVRLWRAARDGIDAALASKEANPLDAVILSVGAVQAINAYGEARDRVLATSKTFTDLNPKLELVKEQAASSDIEALTRDIARLKAIAARHQANIDGLCIAYLTEKQAKAVTGADDCAGCSRQLPRECLSHLRSLDQYLSPALQCGLPATGHVVN